MGKHSRELPPTVEELAAQERARRRARFTRPGLVAASAVAVVAIAATAWAISQPDEAGTPTGADTVRSAWPSAAEGFGQASPTGSAVPSPTRSPSRSSAAPTPGSNTSAPAAPSPAAADASVSAAYVFSTWPDAYKMEFNLTNKAADPALWTMRLQVPAGARLDQIWNAEMSEESPTVWLLRPPRWDGGNPRPIPGGGQFQFGLIVQGAQTVVSCTLDGAPCVRSS